MEKILIVDDRPINREVLSLLLTEQGYDTLEAEDGLEALDLARSHHPNLIITDIAMPRMDGLAFVKSLLNDVHLNTIPVVFYSATYKAAEAHQFASALNVKYVLTKPCDPSVIVNTVKSALKPGIKFFENHETSSFNHDNLIIKEKLENINLRLTTLIEIGLDMSLEHDIDKLIYIMCKGGRQFLNACYAGIIIENPAEPLTYKNIILNKDNHISHYEFRAEALSPSLREVFLSNKNVCIHSPVIDMEKIGLNDISLPFSSLLSLPLKTTRASYGKIYFINKANRRYFTNSDQRFMMTLCDKFAVNYENINLYTAVERHAKLLEEEISQRKKTEAFLQETINDQIQTEEKLRHYREQMAQVVQSNSLGEMASSLAHEINQPLAAIAAYVNGCIKRLKNKKVVTPDIIEILHETVLQAERAGEVVHRIKRFVRKGELFYETVNPNSLIEEIIHMAKQELKKEATKIVYVSNKNLPDIDIDKIQIQQVILNLIRNAHEAMQEVKTPNPQIVIEIKDESLQKENPTNHISISIKDNGPGFLNSIADHLFDLYFTTKPHGMGLGLAISRSIVEAHSGQLSASRLPEGGSIFEFALPFKKLN